MNIKILKKVNRKFILFKSHHDVYFVFILKGKKIISKDFKSLLNASVYRRKEIAKYVRRKRFLSKLQSDIQHFNLIFSFFIGLLIFFYICYKYGK